MNIVINDEVLTCKEGDNVLHVAREHGSHVWFMCDGRGVCRTCACRVASGAENLSPPTAIERESLSETERREGYRLSCQAWVVGPGAVRVASVAEELRTMALQIVRPHAGSRAEPFNQLVREIGELGWNAVTRLPTLPLHAVPQIIAKPPSITGLSRYLADAQRMLTRMLTDAPGSSPRRSDT